MSGNHPGRHPIPARAARGTALDLGREPAWLYLLRQPEWGLLKIGITNVPEIRLQQHGREEWTLVELVGPMDGDLAKNLESDILRLLRIKQAEFARAEVHGRFNGYTEA